MDEFDYVFSNSKKLRAQIVNLLRNSRADPKNGVSY